MDRVRTMTGRLGTALHAARRPVGDVLVVLLLLFFSLGHEYWDSSPPEQATLSVFLFDLALVLPLLWRRRRPGEVFGVIAAVALVQWVLDVRAGGDLAVLFALYAVAAYETRRTVIIGAVAIAELGVVMAAVRWEAAEPTNWVNTVILLTGLVTAALSLGFYLRTRRAYVASVLERAAIAEHERDQQALIATASERARISREMHDIVAHSLSVMIALSDGAAVAATRTPEAAQAAMLEASALGRQALGEMRKLLGGLNGDDDPAASVDLAPQPGIADLDDLVTRVRSAGLAVDLVIIGSPPSLAPGAQLTIYRMIQEALTNILKHAPTATKAVVTLRYGATGVDIEVENDDEAASAEPVTTAPVGPADPADPITRAASGTAMPAGRGLTGMRQRAAVFGGTVEVGRGRDGGWHVTTHLELEDQNPR